MTSSSPESTALPSLQAQSRWRNLPRESLSDRLTSLLNRLQLSPEVGVFLTALLIGSGAGTAMVVFHHWIDICEAIAFGSVLNQLSVWGGWTVALIPALGGLLVGLLRWQYPQSLGQGISTLLSDPQVGMSETNPAGSLFRLLLTLLAAGICLGSGASLGPEGPSVEIGAMIGLLLAQLFQVSQSRYRLLLGAGAAAGLAAGFNAPIAGIFFALEMVLGTVFTAPSISLILLSAVVATIISKASFGSDLLFGLPAYEVISDWEWGLYLGLGILASGLSLLLIQSIQTARACFEQAAFRWLPINPLASVSSPLKPMLGGLIVGTVALYLPQVLGVGYGTLELILKDAFPTDLLGQLMIAKVGLTAISLGSGLVGGIFAPALMVGGCFGSLYGHLLSGWIPADLVAIAPPSAYATVGMAAVLASTVRAPLTAIILLFEMTQNYQIVLPLMLSVGTSVWLVDLATATQTVEKLALPQMGVNLQKQDSAAYLSELLVADHLRTDYLGVSAKGSLIEAAAAMLAAKQLTALVFTDQQQLCGIISLGDIRKQIVPVIAHSEKSSLVKTIDTAGLDAALPTLENILQQLVEKVCTSEVVCIYSHESLAKAQKEMSARGLYLLPVVTADNPRSVLGVIDTQAIEMAADLNWTEQMLHPDLTHDLSDASHLLISQANVV